MGDNFDNYEEGTDIFEFITNGITNTLKLIATILTTPAAYTILIPAVLIPVTQIALNPDVTATVIQMEPRHFCSCTGGTKIFESSTSDILTNSYTTSSYIRSCTFGDHSLGTDGIHWVNSGTNLNQTQCEDACTNMAGGTCYGYHSDGATICRLFKKPTSHVYHDFDNSHGKCYVRNQKGMGSNQHDDLACAKRCSDDSTCKFATVSYFSNKQQQDDMGGFPTCTTYSACPTVSCPDSHKYVQLNDAQFLYHSWEKVEKGSLKIN